MNLVTVAPSIPNPSSGGGGNWNASLIKYFASTGHKVTHIAVIGKHAGITAQPELIATYKQLGVDVIVIPFHSVASAKSVNGIARKILNPQFSDFWPSEWSTRPAVAATIEDLNPDCVLPFAFDAVLYTHGIIRYPRVAFQAEGPHINTFVNWKYDPEVERGISFRYLSYTGRTLLAARIQEKLYIELTRALSIAAFAGPHYVKWARDRRLTNACFITTPVADPVGNGWRQLRASAPRHDKCRILMIGHLHSTSNRSGLPIFFNEVLPALERKWGTDKFEVHIVGRNDAMPSRFDKWRSHPALRFRGPVYPADSEFLQATMLLVTVPAPTGSRVRILNGFSYGCPIVAHSANALGIPELKHGDNVLMSNTGEGLADLIIRAANDPALSEKLGENGRSTYERFYTEEAGGAQYLEYIEQAIARHKSYTANAVPKEVASEEIVT